MWRATYCWKAIDEGYNFVLDLISIGGLHAKLWAPQSRRSPSRENFMTPIECHLGIGPVAKHIVYYKGEGGGFPQVQAVVSLVNPSLPMARPSTKSALAMH
jgi:hypothetical protein